MYKHILITIVIISGCLSGNFIQAMGGWPEPLGKAEAYGESGGLRALSNEELKQEFDRLSKEKNLILEDFKKNYPNSKYGLLAWNSNKRFRDLNAELADIEEEFSRRGLV